MPVDELSKAVLAELPRGWTVEVDRHENGADLRCEHVVLGEYNVSWHRGLEESAPQPERLVLDRLVDTGLAEASRTMPELSDEDVETLRRAFAFIGAGRLSRLQAYELVSFAQSLTGLSRQGWEWARRAIDQLAPLYEYPAHPHRGEPVSRRT